MGTPSTKTIMLPLADELFCLVQASNCCAVGTKPTTPALEYPNAEDSTCLNVCLLIPVNPVLQYLNKKYVLKSASVPGTGADTVLSTGGVATSVLVTFISTRAVP